MLAVIFFIRGYCKDWNSTYVDIRGAPEISDCTDATTDMDENSKNNSVFTQNLVNRLDIFISCINWIIIVSDGLLNIKFLDAKVDT